MTLPIITADERLAEPRGIKGCIFGKSGLGKTSLLWTLERLDHALHRPRGRRSRDRGLGGRHASARAPGRSAATSRSSSAGRTRRCATTSPTARRTSTRSARSFGDPAVLDTLRHDLHRLDHRRRAALLPVVQGPARGHLGEDRQARHARRLRAARPRDDRLADPPAAHARRRTSGSSGSSTRSSTTSIARSSSRRSTARRPGSSCRASSTRSSPWPRSRTRTASRSAPSSARR